MSMRALPADWDAVQNVEERGRRSQRVFRPRSRWRSRMRDSDSETDACLAVEEYLFGVTSHRISKDLSIYVGSTCM